MTDSWFKPFSKAQVSGCMEDEGLSTRIWIPPGSVFITSDKDSMTQRLLKHLLVHMNKFVRKWVPANEKFVFPLDGLSSRGG